MEMLKEQHLNTTVFFNQRSPIIFDQFYASLLNKSIKLFKKYK